METLCSTEHREFGVFQGQTIPYFICDTNALRGLKNAFPTPPRFSSFSRKCAFGRSCFFDHSFTPY